MKVLVTGMGAISSIGNNVLENHLSLQEGKTGITNSKFFNSKYSEVFPFGEIKLSNDNLKQELQNSIVSLEDFTRTDLIAFKAFKEAIKDSRLTKEQITNRRTVFISSSTVGGMCETDSLYLDSNLKKEQASKFIHSYSGTAHLYKIVEHYKMKGMTNGINTACSSSANAIILGAKLIKAGIVDTAIVGGADTLSKYTVNGFNSLQIVSKNHCRPFDDNRQGLNLGEGAAFLVLEKEKNCINKTKHAEILSWGNSNDAYHASSLSNDANGIILSISKALNSASIKNVDYVNTHGTSTKNNDYSELMGLSKKFKKIPPFNSTKSYTGHTLAASGALEAIFSILSINNNEIYKSLNVETPIKPFNIFPQKEYTKVDKLDYVLSNSFGFGGNCTSLILKKCI